MYFLGCDCGAQTLTSTQKQKKWEEKVKRSEDDSDGVVETTPAA